jgi:hypothetical protein
MNDVHADRVESINTVTDEATSVGIVMTDGRLKRD